MISGYLYLRSGTSRNYRRKIETFHFPRLIRAETETYSYFVIFSQQCVFDIVRNIQDTPQNCSHIVGKNQWYVKSYGFLKRGIFRVTFFHQSLVEFVLFQLIKLFPLTATEIFQFSISYDGFECVRDTLNQRHTNTVHFEKYGKSTEFPAKKCIDIIVARKKKSF